MDFNYGGYSDKYDMSGDIRIGTGIVRVHNLEDGVPDFMLDCDCIFSDPPCSNANVRSFYTKADLDKSSIDFSKFYKVFWEAIDKIKPKKLFLEVFKSNKDSFLQEVEKRYGIVKIYDSFYYGQKKNQCWIIYGGDTEGTIDLNGIDEQYAIEAICKNVSFDVIGDVCMGKGLVGFYANKYGRPFRGTELNKKRLAFLLERINTGKIIMK